MSRIVLIFLLLTAEVFFLSGCDFFSETSITVSFPDAFPEESDCNFTIDSWILEYPAEMNNGIPVYTEFEVETKNQTVGQIHISIARGVNLPVLACPVFGCGDLKGLSGNYPAGAVYPADLNDGRLELQWQDGFACRIIKSCLLNSDMISGFDTEAFRLSLQEEVETIIDSDGGVLPGGVWLIDPDPIISRLGYGLFRESSIRAAETIVFSIPASQGRFSSDNPFYPVVSSANGYLEAVVPKDLRTIFINPDSQELIELYFDSKIWCWSNLTNGASESGRR